MTRIIMLNRLIVSWAIVTIFTIAPAAAQLDAGPLAAARNLYVSARYEDALDVLDRLRGDGRADPKLVEKYRSLCLLALGRPSEAERAIAAVVTADPTYQPDEAEASPRVRATFADVRRRLLPEIAAARYAAAKAIYDTRDWTEAVEQFRLVLSLIDDPDAGGRLGDLRLLAAGFLELSMQAELAAAARADVAPGAPAGAPVEPAVPAAAHVPPVAHEEPNRIYSGTDAAVVPPVTLRQDLPKLPSSLTSMARSRGLMEIVIDEKGRVVSMAIRESIQPTFDLQLLTAARDWRYEPATVDGRPVRFRKLIHVNVSR